MKQPVIPKPTRAFVKQLNRISSLPQIHTKSLNKGFPVWLGSSVSLVVLGFILIVLTVPMTEPKTIPITASLSLLDEWQSINEAYVIAFIEEPEWY